MGGISVGQRIGSALAQWTATYQAIRPPGGAQPTETLRAVLQRSQRLPKSVQQIADVIGRGAAIQLINSLPRAYTAGHPLGQPILYVPRSLRANHRLVRILGFQDAQRIVEAFGGEILYPAACLGVIRDARNLRISDLLDEGWHEFDVARVFGLTVRQLRNVRKEIAPEPRQAKQQQYALQFEASAT